MAEQTNYASYILPIGIVAAVIIGGKKVLEALHIIDSKDAKATAAEAAAELKKDYWKGSWYKALQASGKSVMVVNSTAAQKLIEQLYEAKGVFNDNENSVYGFFSAIHTQTQLSYLCDKFQQAYGMDILSYIHPSTGFLNADEFARVVSIVSKYTSGVQ